MVRSTNPTRVLYPGKVIQAATATGIGAGDGARRAQQGDQLFIDPLTETLNIRGMDQEFSTVLGKVAHGLGGHRGVGDGLPAIRCHMPTIANPSA